MHNIYTIMHSNSQHWEKLPGKRYQVEHCNFSSEPERYTGHLASLSPRAVRTPTLPSPYNMVSLVPWQGRPAAGIVWNYGKGTPSAGLGSHGDKIRRAARSYSVGKGAQVSARRVGSRGPAADPRHSDDRLFTEGSSGFPVQLLQLTAGAGKPRPRSQVWPTACICTASERRTDFTF